MADVSEEHDRPKPRLGAPLSDGEWAGWSMWNGNEPFEDHAGPYYARREEDGRMVCGCRVQPKHLNGFGSVHGGALMAFADYSLFHIATDDLVGVPSMTVAFNCELLAPAPAGSLLTCRGEVVRAGRSLLFVRGLIHADSEPVLSFSSVLKIGRPRGRDHMEPE